MQFGRSRGAARGVARRLSRARTASRSRPPASAAWSRRGRWPRSSRCSAGPTPSRASSSPASGAAAGMGVPTANLEVPARHRPAEPRRLRGRAVLDRGAAPPPSTSAWHRRSRRPTPSATLRMEAFLLDHDGSDIYGQHDADRVPRAATRRAALRLGRGPDGAGHRRTSSAPGRSPPARSRAPPPERRSSGPSRASKCERANWPMTARPIGAVAGSRLESGIGAHGGRPRPPGSAPANCEGANWHSAPLPIDTPPAVAGARPPRSDAAALARRPGSV